MNPFGMTTKKDVRRSSHLKSLPPNIVHALSDLFSMHDREEFARDFERLEELVILHGAEDGSVTSEDFNALYFLRQLGKVLSKPAEVAGSMN